MANEYSIKAKITADSTGFEKGIKAAQNSLKGFSSSISSAMKLAGGLFAVGSIAQLGKALSDMSQSYAKATQNIVRGTGAVGEQLKVLQKSVSDSLINGVGRDASELGEMVADLNTRLGVTGETLTELVGQFDDFSDVTGTDTKTAINSVSDILAKWNIETSQTVPLLDQLTAASQASGASVTELTSGLKSGQAVFSQFGMSATESMAFLGTLKKNGIDTSSAIMGMKTALANFAKSGVDAKTAFAEISESIKKAGSQTEALSIATETFGQRNGAEFVRILSGGADGVDAFTKALENAGGTLAKTSEASRTSADALQDLKATIAGVFATSGTDNGLRDLIDDVAEAIRNFDFTSIKETFSNIGLFIQGIWEQFKALFNNLSGAVDITGGNFKVFADIIYQNLNGAYQVIQDFVGMISAVLNGDWSLAWEYAKLIVLRTVKQLEESINNAIRLMPNLFNSVIDGYNWVLKQQDKLFIEILHLPEKYFKSVKLPKYEGKDLIDTKSIEEAIEKVRQTIESKTGEAADRTLAELKRQKTAVHDTTQSVTADIGSFGTAVENTTETTGKKTTVFLKEWRKQYEDLAGDWNKTFVDMANTATSAMGDMFETIGQGLVNNGIGYEDFASIAVEALAEVLKGLAAQLSALAAVNAATYNYGQASLAAAGAAAALVAAGTLKAVAGNMKDTATAAKEATDSIDDFIERLKKIRENRFTKIGTFSQGILEYSAEIEKALGSMNKAYDEYIKKQKAYNDASDSDFRKRTEAYAAMSIAEMNYLNWVKKVNKANNGLSDSLTELARSSQDVVDENSKITSSYKELFDSLTKYSEMKKKLFYTDDAKYLLIKSGIAAGKLSDTIRFQYEKYKAYLITLENNIKAQVQEMRNGVYESMLSVGKDIGGIFVSSIVDGAKSKDFMSSIRDYIKRQMVQLVVLTEDFSASLSDIGVRLLSAMTTGSAASLSVIKAELLGLYSEMASRANDVEKILGSVFDEVVGEIKDKVGEIKKELSQEAQSIGDTLMQSILNGAKNNDFRNSMKAYVRETAVKTVIFSSSLTNTLTSIGAQLSKAVLSKDKNLMLSLRNNLTYIFTKTQTQVKDVLSIIDDAFFDSSVYFDKAETSFQEAVKSFSDSIKDLGGDVAGNFISSLNSGLDLDSALISFKKFIRNYVIQSAVYTSSLKSEMEKIGQGIAAYVSGKNKNTGLISISNKFEKTYKKLAADISKVDEYLDKIFGKEEDKKVEETTETVEKSLSKIEKAMESFKETVSDLGGDIASNLVEGLSNGLSQSDFLSNMKDWIRKMLVQSVVYTEQMKSEIEAIGKSISNAISGGFTETSMHEIRRDLSYIFESASSRMSGIDKILGGVFDGYANGTTSALSGLHIVGEQGPELVRFNGGERVYNNADTMKMIAGAGTTINQNVTFNNLRDTSAFAMMRQLKQYNREMAINSIM